MKKTMALAMAGLMVLVAISISANAAVNQQQTSGRLEGCVKEWKQDSAPIEGAKVWIAGGYIEEWNWNLVLTHYETESDGSYSFDDIPEGKYTMLVIADGFFSSARFTSITAGQTTTVIFHLVSKPKALNEPLQGQQQPLAR